MDPSAIGSYRRGVDRAHRQVERLAALSAQAGALSRGMKQEPKRHALADAGGMFLPRFPIGLVKCTPVDHGPIVSRPFRRASPIGGTTWVSIFRAAGPTGRVGAFLSRKETAVMVAGDLLSHRIVAAYTNADPPGRPAPLVKRGSAAPLQLPVPKGTGATGAPAQSADLRGGGAAPVCASLRQFLIAG
jgi:hypothetical protein